MNLNIWKNITKSKATSTVAENQIQRLLEGRTIGQPLHYGHLSMIPIFGSNCQAGAYAAPETALKLTSVRTYGEMHLNNLAEKPTIVPLNLGYFQQGAQNHALCTGWILAPNEEKLFKDACCIQASQGGYIKNSDERFIVLPHQLRKKALALQGINNYSKLWSSIALFNNGLGLKNRGHLDELKQAFQPELLQTTYHLELQPNQTGAIFLCQDEVMGIELAPDANYWAELHKPLVMYCYAPLRLQLEQQNIEPKRGQALNTEGVTTLKALKEVYQTTQMNRMVTAKNTVTTIGGERFEAQTHQKFDNDKLLNIKTMTFEGQAVMHGQAVAYVSLFNHKAYQIEGK